MHQIGVAGGDPPDANAREAERLRHGREADRGRVDAGRGRQRLALSHQAIGLVADEADAGGLADLDGHLL